MDRYTARTYGDAFADVYDAWYHDVSDVDATVALVAELAGQGGRVLELGAGTGRLAVPLAAAGLAVTALDASPAMIERLRERDPDGAVGVVLGDMVDDLPAGPFDVVLAAYNTFFNLLTAERQRAAFAGVATRLSPSGGAFVIEAFVPDEELAAGATVDVRSMTADEVVLSITTRDPVAGRVDGQFVHLRDGAPVRLRPWAVRYCSPAELDEMAAHAGLTLGERWEDVECRPFSASSARHVSVYRRAMATT